MLGAMPAILPPSWAPRRSFPCHWPTMPAIHSSARLLFVLFSFFRFLVRSARIESSTARPIKTRLKNSFGTQSNGGKCGRRSCVNHAIHSYKFGKKTAKNLMKISYLLLIFWSKKSFLLEKITMESTDKNLFSSSFRGAR